MPSGKPPSSGDSAEVRLDGGPLHGHLVVIDPTVDDYVVRDVDGAGRTVRYTKTVETDESDRPLFGYVP